MTSSEKTQAYETLCKQIAQLILGEKNVTSVLANVASALHFAFLERLFWTGFYLVHGEELQLGPFQGTVACMHIGRGRGVCGTAWAENRTLIVVQKSLCRFISRMAASGASLILIARCFRPLILLMLTISKSLKIF